MSKEPRDASSVFVLPVPGVEIYFSTETDEIQSWVRPAWASLLADEAEEEQPRSSGSESSH